MRQVVAKLIVFDFFIRPATWIEGKNVKVQDTGQSDVKLGEERTMFVLPRRRL
jgi:hypothetical protein